MSAAKAGGSFSEGAVSGIKNAAKLSNLTTAGQQLASGQFGQSGYDALTASKAAAGDQMFAGLADAPPTAAQEIAAATDFGAGQGAYDPNLAATPMGATDAGLDAPTRNQLYGVQPRPVVQGAPNNVAAGPKFVQSPDATQIYDPANLVNTPTTTLDTLKGYGETAMDYGRKGMDFLTGGTPTTGDIQIKTADILGADTTGKMTYDKAFDLAKSELTPGIIRSYGPSLALAAGATAALGGFTPDELDEMSDEERLEALGPSGYELYMANKAQYGLKAETPQYAQGPTVIPTTFSQGLLPLPPLAVAEGGEIFPRRVGGIMPNEGTPGKDSVRAMLMPGEFVMTTDAVRGLGNGNNDQGIRNMYDMMRGLEAKGRATA
jgi:hypothetical protein